MACGKDTSVQDCDQKVSSLVISISKGRYQRDCDDIDNADCDHGADRTEGIDLCPLFDVLCHGAAQGSVGNIDTGIAQYENTVCDCHIHDFYIGRPVRMRPEGQHQYNCGQRSRDQQPGPVSSPAGMGLIAQPADHRIIDCIPESGEQHQPCNCPHSDSKYIRIKNHQKVSYKHPAEITPHVAHTVSNLTDQWYFYIRFLLFHHDPPCPVQYDFYMLKACSARLSAQP